MTGVQTCALPISTNWGLSPDEADAWLANEMIPYYPLGIFKTPEVAAVEGARHDH